MSSSTQAATPFKTYPLKALFALPSNVRKQKRTPEAIRAMAQSIAAHGGLLQNLVVVPEFKDGKPTGRAGVTAGETRRQALCLLRDGGLPDVEGFTDDYPVVVLEVSDEEAVAASASENILRTAMHPADQFEAFRDLHEQCGDVEQVANFFGVTPLMVRQRLKLANASPRLFQVYREDGMTLEQLMALCITDDHAAQEKVWDGTRNSPWERAAERLRQALTDSELDTRSPLVQLVGLRAYEKEGGRIRRDLFAEDDAGFVIDVDLLKRLAEAKLNKAADAVRQEGWGWVEVRTTPFADAYHYGRATMGRRPLSGEEESQVSALEAAIAADGAALDAMYDADDEPDGDEAKLAALSTRLDAARATLRDLEASFAAWTPEVLAVAGAVVAPERNGKVAIHRALVRPEDRKAAARAARPVQVAAGAGSGSGPAAAPKAAESESLTRRLTAQRTIALQRVLADHTQVALAALAHNLLQRLLLDHGHVPSALDIHAKGCEPQLDAATESAVRLSRAWLELKGLREQWGEHLPGDLDKLLPWLIGLSLSELCDLLALCSALTLNCVQSRPLKHPADGIAAAVGLDMADWWAPTGSEYLASVPKAQIARALVEAGLPQDAAAVEQLKKGEAVARAEELLAGRRWLPAVLRRPV